MGSFDSCSTISWESSLGCAAEEVATRWCHVAGGPKTRLSIAAAKHGSVHCTSISVLWSCRAVSFKQMQLNAWLLAGCMVPALCTSLSAVGLAPKMASLPKAVLQSKQSRFIKHLTLLSFKPLRKPWWKPCFWDSSAKLWFQICCAGSGVGIYRVKSSDFCRRGCLHSGSCLCAKYSSQGG